MDSLCGHTLLLERVIIEELEPSQTEPDPLAIGGYAVVQRLDSGGMAEVFVARRCGPHGFVKHVALKRILPQLARHPEFVSLFVQEARLAARLEHPHIVQVFDFGEDKGELFLAMELVDGSNIHKLLHAANEQGVEIPIDVALHIASQVAHALAHAHRMCDDEGKRLNLVHRDVSPANILITRSGHAKLTDFGIVRAAGADIPTAANPLRGKLGYMSPEQVSGQAVDGRSDVFTLCVILTELLYGVALFEGATELEVLLRIRDADLRAIERSTRTLHPEMVRVLRKGLKRLPEERPDAQSLARAIDRLRAERHSLADGPERLTALMAQLGLIEKQAQRFVRTPSIRPTSSNDSRDRPTTQFPQANVSSGEPTAYRVSRMPGSPTEPMSFPRLVEMITSGEVTSDTLVAKEDGDYLKAGSMPELARYVTSPGLQWQSAEISDVTHSGTLGRGELLRFVHGLAVTRDTGVLHLQCENRRKKIYYVEGRPEFVASTDKAELLGEYLVSSGMCLRMEIDMALALLPRYGGRLGDALVGLNVLRSVELFRAISAQVRARYLDSFSWTEGQWSYVHGARSHEEIFPLGHDPYELMRDAAMHTSKQEIETALANLWVVHFTREARPPIALSEYRLHASWNRLFESVQESETLADIAARAAEQDLCELKSLFRALYLGVACGILLPAPEGLDL